MDFFPSSCARRGARQLDHAHDAVPAGSSPGRRQRMSRWPTPGRVGREAWGRWGSWLGVRTYVRGEAVGGSGAQLLKPAAVDWRQGRKEKKRITNIITTTLRTNSDKTSQSNSHLVLNRSTGYEQWRPWLPPAPASPGTADATPRQPRTAHLSESRWSRACGAWPPSAPPTPAPRPPRRPC